MKFAVEIAKSIDDNQIMKIEGKHSKCMAYYCKNVMNIVQLLKNEKAQHVQGQHDYLKIVFGYKEFAE
ncbi:MAG: hypothetical protein ACTSVI_06690, partial [Promethearchaeota archaeon]